MVIPHVHYRAANIHCYPYFILVLSVSVGVTAQLSDITSCEGDTVTFTCTVDAIGHTWNISSAGTLTTTRADPTTSSPPFTAQIVDDNNDMINSTLTFVSFAGINESVISCTDANAAVGEGETQEAMAFVYGEELFSGADRGSSGDRTLPPPPPLHNFFCIYP